ncbi:MAG: hypothetical protein AAFO06_19895 [Cyanobacteria bacterium J06597_16]
MQLTDTTLFPAPDPVQDNWNFLEAWVDPLQSPPYVLLLLGDKVGSCRILDPKEGYSLIKHCESYDEAQLWLLEDEYEPLEGRLPSDEV